MHISGKFVVHLQPLEPYDRGKDGINLGRMSIDKTFYGQLSASSKGEMLSVMTPVEGSAGYVAIEHVTGALDGKEGSFALQHYGKMEQGENDLLLEVVPGSGTGALAGLSGKMNIRIENGEHYYEFDYELAKG